MPTCSERRRRQIIIAVDEAGRGPLAGPITVAAAMVDSKQKFGFKFKNNRCLKNIRDSKKLSAKQREEWFDVLKDNFEYKVAMVGPAVIDRIGIQAATRLAVARILRKLSRLNLNSWESVVLLDGLLKAPKHYNQQTIIGGDEKIPLISAASIIAKVARDKKMRRLHKLYPDYCLDSHKGYGTKLHYKMLKKNGISDIHRRSFLKNLTKKK